ncbi:unnamed protein product [Pseudo-nitzschia multistriata]|uniref:Sulfatase N-terminal domain-containing protein n=1 Tax=Pseudo-nitzschia multistriata TaxID=183589 RepID=A0A448ZDF9_9STRA|nr:unnamed protein product [Pseudo-nitzschia multistriata]
MQPDDFRFLDNWTPPPNTPDNPNLADPFPAVGLPNIERLRTNGLQMMQAYTGSPMCGTSRFSTMTGRLPSRASTVISESGSEGWIPSWITIPSTKLEGTDCSRDNLAVAFRDAGYYTAMTGKWHLSRIDRDNYDYDKAVDIVKGCGFDHVDGLYVENMANGGENRPFNSYSDGTFSHNMEWVTHSAINFIKESSSSNTPFFLYVNPTVPHGSRGIREALTSFSCRDTANHNQVWESDPWIKGMSEDGGCAAYRQTILDRAESDDDLGKIWLDDSVGALLTALEDNGQLDNTIFLFQEDHGTDTKSALFEGGIRIPQFVHYPNFIPPSQRFDGLVSVYDIAPTMLDYAGISPPYQFDGKSWKHAIFNPTEEQNWKHSRCIFAEMQTDRAVRCGCYKYIKIYDTEWSNTYWRAERHMLVGELHGNLYDLCDGTGDYITANDNNREAVAFVDPDVESALVNTLQCHLDRSHPQRTQDFSVCASPFEPEPVPEPVPTQSPTTAGAFCDDSPLRVKKFDTCEGVVEAGKCGSKKYWSHCRDSCGKCDKCTDSKQTLKLAEKIKVVTKKDGEKITKNKKSVTCRAVKKAVNKKKLCKNSDIAVSCVKTCGGC